MIAQQGTGKPDMGRQFNQLNIVRPVLAENALVFDRTRFESNTMYDFALQCEILGLFQSQVEQIQSRLSQGALSAEDAKFVSHTLRGAAASVGAVELEDIGANWEKLSLAGFDLAMGLESANERFKLTTSHYKI
jgi:HPt (histidine-containing phosphotransfer) domain-containing protein